MTYRMRSCEHGLLNLIFIIIFNPSVSQRLDVSPIFSDEKTGAKMITTNTSQTYGYRNPTMKHAVRNRGVYGDRIRHYVGDVVQE